MGKWKNMPYTASFTLRSRYISKTPTSVSPWAPGFAITAASVEEKVYKGFKVLISSGCCHIFFFHSVEISDSSSKVDVKVTLLRQTLSFCRFSLARFFADLHWPRAWHRLDRIQRRNDAKNINYSLARVSEKKKEHSPCGLLISIREVLWNSSIENCTKTQNVVWLEKNILRASSVLYSMLFLLAVNIQN